MTSETRNTKEWYESWRVLVFCGLFFAGGWLLGLTRPPDEQGIIDGFHRWYVYNEERTWRNTYWIGVPAWKTPLDLWVFQEILYETQPDVIIETGTYKGGSAFFFASICELLGHGRVLTIDIEEFPGRPQHPRITYLLGDSTAQSTGELVRSLIRQGERVMVVLDSKHTKDHVLKELALWARLVSVGSYLVVEDTQLNGNPVMPDYGPAAKEAVEEFLSRNSNFQRDESREKFGLTFQPGGWLRRVQ